jgi:hypothetical protein
VCGGKGEGDLRNVPTQRKTDKCFKKTERNRRLKRWGQKRQTNMQTDVLTKYRKRDRKSHRQMGRYPEGHNDRFSDKQKRNADRITIGRTERIAFTQNDRHSKGQTNKRRDRKIDSNLYRRIDRQNKYRHKERNAKMIEIHIQNNSQVEG